LQRGEVNVSGFDKNLPRRQPPGAHILLGNVSDYVAVREACRGIDVVFVTAAVMLFSERLPWQYKTSHEFCDIVLGRSSATSLEGRGSWRQGRVHISNDVRDFAREWNVPPARRISLSLRG